MRHRRRSRRRRRRTGGARRRRRARGTACAAAAAPAAVSPAVPISRASPARRSRASRTSRRCRSSARRTRRSPDDPFFRYFFGDGDDVFGSRDRRSLSLGSGVVISADGYVVTNNHVVGENVARDHGRARPTSARSRGTVDRHRPGHGHRAAEDRRRTDCRSCRGATRASCRSANGCWRSAARFS